MNALIELSQQNMAFYLGLVAAVSLMVGSFLNVVIYRLPVMMERSFKAECEAYTHPEQEPAPQPAFNLVKPDSTCPHCGHNIRAWENIPIISYLFLKGRCASCKASISVRYPLVEAATALLCTWVAWHFGPTMQGLAAVLVCYLLVAMIMIDFDHMLLPDQLTLPMLWFGLLLSLNNVFVDAHTAIIGAAAGYLSLWSVYWLFKLITGKEGMGYGDFKLLAALGAFTGWQGLPVIIILSSLVGAVIGIALMLKQGKDGTLAIPFGPYLAIAGLLTLLYKQPIIDAYLQWVLA
ncbi:prepilin peptidase [Salinimonas lutimaris]|uniref:prepilin peptidase n=1 Tax=Salinimonas lutimaris TaxID=914153 RepID=UPI0010C14ED4|nr:A24 family peptidase [Salinimonas lutimaris]